MKVKKCQGDKFTFMGGNEITPEVEIVLHGPHPGSLQRENEKVLRISQNGQYVQVSAKTLQAILDWACEMHTYYCG